MRSVGPRHKENPLSLDLKFDQGNHPEFACLVFTCAREKEEARLGFIAAVKAVKGLVLAAVPLPLMKYRLHGSQYRIIILAKQTEDPLEVQVCATAKVFWLAKSPETSLNTCLISYQSFVNHRSLNEEHDMVQNAFTTTIDETVAYSSKAHRLVRKSSLKGLRRLLNNNTDVDLNAADAAGWMPLHWAIALEQPVESVVKLLLDHGARQNLKSNSAKTPLILAIELGGSSVIGILLDHVATQVSVNGISPLTQALYSKRPVEIVNDLILHGVDINGIDELGRTPIFHTISPESLECPLYAGADPSAYNQSGISVLHSATSNDEPALIQKLVQFGAAVDILEKDSDHSSLYYADINQNENSVRALLELYANANRRYQDGETLLMHSIETRNSRL
jgi:ankyrin repeat protein